MSVRPIDVVVMTSAGLDACEATLKLPLMSFEILTACLRARFHVARLGSCSAGCASQPGVTVSDPAQSSSRSNAGLLSGGLMKA